MLNHYLFKKIKLIGNGRLNYYILPMLAMEKGKMSWRTSP
jgi:hypothetical protein